MYLQKGYGYAFCPLFPSLQGNEVLNGLTAKQYELVIKLLENAILSTDLAIYFKYVKVALLVSNFGTHFYCLTESITPFTL